MSIYTAIFFISFALCIQLSQIEIAQAINAKEAAYVTGDILLESLKATNGDISPGACLKFGKTLVSEMAKKKLDSLEDKSDTELVEVLESLRDARIIKTPKVIKFAFGRTLDSCQNVLENVGKAVSPRGDKIRDITPEIELSDLSDSDSDSDSDPESEWDYDPENNIEMKTFKGPVNEITL